MNNIHVLKINKKSEPKIGCGMPSTVSPGCADLVTHHCSTHPAPTPLPHPVPRFKLNHMHNTAGNVWHWVENNEQKQKMKNWCHNSNFDALRDILQPWCVACGMWQTGFEMQMGAWFFPTTSASLGDTCVPNEPKCTRAHNECIEGSQGSRSNLSLSFSPPSPLFSSFFSLFFPFPLLLMWPVRSNMLSPAWSKSRGRLLVGGGDLFSFWNCNCPFLKTHSPFLKTHCPFNCLLKEQKKARILATKIKSKWCNFSKDLQPFAKAHLGRFANFV